ncbi:MAG: hypothetical protein JNL39_21720 [Opitutaceae bacterium]|nr:hypothetical protein [Opitutaceae bacterium]
MDEFLLRALHARRPAIRRQWESLLRLEKPASPLALPDMLVRMIDLTMDEAFAALGHAGRRAPRSRAAPGRTPGYEEVRRSCACGQNPLIEYFLAGERAMLEALVLAQAEVGGPAVGSHRMVATEVHLVLRCIARREVGLFCSVCQLRLASAPGECPGRREPAAV